MRPEHPLAAPSHADPYPYYRQLVQERPWHYDAELKLWIAASRQVVTAVLAHPACRVRPVAEPVPAALAGRPLGEVYARWLRMSEAPRHAELRLAVERSLSAVTTRAWKQSAFELADAYLANHPLDGAALDGLLAFLPVATLARQLGFAPDALADVARRVGHIVRALLPNADAAALHAGDLACQALADALPRIGEGWLAVWKQQGWDEADLVANAIGALFQSRDACAGLLGAGIAWMAHEPWPLDDETAWRQRLARDPVLHNTRRFVAEDCELLGQKLRQGDAVLVLLAAAALAGDEAMDFGRGRHACPGEQMALAIAQGGLAALGTRKPDWRALCAQMSYRPLPNARVRGFGKED